MAHYVHNLLFHAGSEGVFSWAAPQTVEAELYRANQIEAADTVFARGTLENNVTFCLAATHACETKLHHCELIDCDEASIEVSEAGKGIVKYRDGREEDFSADSLSLRENLHGYCEYVRGSRPRPVTMLQDCRPFVTLNALLYPAAGAIHSVKGAVSITVGNDTSPTRCIPGIEAACEVALRSGTFPSAQHLPWGRPGGTCSWDDLSRLRCALDRILSPLPKNGRTAGCPETGSRTRP